MSRKTRRAGHRELIVRKQSPAAQLAAVRSPLAPDSSSSINRPFKRLGMHFSPFLEKFVELK